MKLKYCLCFSFLGAFSLFFSCESKSSLQKVDRDIANEVSVDYDQPAWIGSFLDMSPLDKLDTASFIKSNEKSQLTLLYYFRGDCSSCIASFIEWCAKWKKDELNSDQIGVSLVSRTSDADLLMHYLRVAEMELQNNLFLDGDDLIAQNNDVIGESDLYTQILLIDNDGKVLAFGDPLTFQNVREIYSKNLMQ